VLRIATNLLDVPAEIISLIYRFRWTMELFFRFFKQILGCRHLYFRSENGIKLQAYCAIIACMLICLWTGRKPTKRTYEMVCYYFLGMASEAKLLKHLEKLKPQDTTSPSARRARAPATPDAWPFRLRGTLPAASAEGPERGVACRHRRPDRAHQPGVAVGRCVFRDGDGHAPSSLRLSRLGGASVDPSPRCLPPCPEGTTETRQTQRDEPPQLQPVSVGAPVTPPHTPQAGSPRSGSAIPGLWWGFVSTTLAGASGWCRRGQRVTPGRDQGLRTPGACPQSSRVACRTEFAAPRLPIRQSQTSLGCTPSPSSVHRYL